MSEIHTGEDGASAKGAQERKHDVASHAKHDRHLEPGREDLSPEEEEREEGEEEADAGALQESDVDARRHCEAQRSASASEPTKERTRGD